MALDNNSDGPQKPSNPQNNPWGNPGGKKGAPDLEEMFRNFFKPKDPKAPSGERKPEDKKPSSTPGKSVNWTPWVSLIGAVVVVLWALSGIIVVQPAEEGVVLRFGQYIKTVEPGPHWYPRFIDRVIVVNVDQVHSLTIQQSMLTSEANLVNVQFAIQYRVGDLQAFLFNAVDPVQTLDQIADSSIRQVIGTSSLDDVLTVGRAAISAKVQQQMEALVNTYHLGIVIVAVTMQPASPPKAVQAAFDDVNKAQEESQRIINMAQTYASSIVPVAQGQAARDIQQAQAYQQQVVLNAEGQVAQWKALLPVYTQYPHVMQTRMYFDAMTSVLQKARVAVVDAGDKGNATFYVPLGMSAAAPAMPGMPLNTGTAPMGNNNTSANANVGSAAPAANPTNSGAATYTTSSNAGVESGSGSGSTATQNAELRWQEANNNG